MTTLPAGRWSIQSARLLDREGLWDLEVDSEHLGATSRSDHADQSRPSIDVGGRLVLPGFVDCHVHLLSMARRRRRLDLGAQRITDVATLRRALVTAAASRPAGTWVDAINFDETVMTAGWLPTRSWLDGITGEIPVRVQHGSQRFDVLNSAAVNRLETPRANADGQVFGGLRQLDVRRDEASERTLLDDLAAVSHELVAAGVTTVQDAGADNGSFDLALMARSRRDGLLKVNCAAMVGMRHLEAAAAAPPEIAVSHMKLECVEGRPVLDELVAAGLRARELGLAVALHAVTDAEVAMAVAVLTEIAAVAGKPALGLDRIEHAGQTPDSLVAAVAVTGAAVVANPSFIAVRGARYRGLVPPAEHHQLHRLRSWDEREVPLAIASDAPITPCLPLSLIHDACSRQTGDGFPIGLAEALSPRAAIDAMTRAPRRLLGHANWSDPMSRGAVADLAVIDGPLETSPGRCRIAMTVIGGAVQFANQQLAREAERCSAA